MFVLLLFFVCLLVCFWFLRGGLLGLGFFLFSFLSYKIEQIFQIDRHIRRFSSPDCIKLSYKVSCKSVLDLTTITTFVVMVSYCIWTCLYVEAVLVQDTEQDCFGLE